MKKNQKKIIIILFLLLLLRILFFTKTPEINGWVVDADTGKPLENVLIRYSVVEEYCQIVQTNFRNVSTDLIVTDKKGKFNIPAKTFFVTKLLLSSIRGFEIYFWTNEYECKAASSGSEVQPLKLKKVSNEPEKWDKAIADAENYLLAEEVPKIKKKLYIDLIIKDANNKIVKFKDKGLFGYTTGCNLIERKKMFEQGEKQK